MATAWPSEEYRASVPPHPDSGSSGWPPTQTTLSRERGAVCATASAGTERARTSRREGFIGLCLGQFARVLLDFADRLGDLLHAVSRRKQHGFHKPDGLFTKTVVRRAAVAFFPRCNF